MMSGQKNLTSTLVCISATKTEASISNSSRRKMRMKQSLSKIMKKMTKKRVKMS